MPIPLIHVSVIVCVYNRQEYISQCLSSILKQELKTFELIVVDDGSFDATVSIIHSFNDPRIRLVLNATNRGMCYSRNQGIAHANGEMIVFTDSDCTCNPGWLDALIEPFDIDKNIMITGGRIIDPTARTYWQKVNMGINHIASASGYVDKIIGCNMAFRRQFLIDNPFDKDLSAADEWDLCISCKRQKKEIFYTDKAMVIHHHRSSLKSSLAQHFRFGYSNASLKIKHGELPYFSYGALCAVFVVLCLIAGIWFYQFSYLAGVFSLLYMILIGYLNTRSRTRPWQEWIITFPGYALLFGAFCFGNLYYPINLIKQARIRLIIKFSRK